MRVRLGFYISHEVECRCRAPGLWMDGWIDGLMDWLWWEGNDDETISRGRVLQGERQREKRAETINVEKESLV